MNQHVPMRNRLNDGMDKDDPQAIQNRSRIYQYQVTAQRWLSQIQGHHRSHRGRRAGDNQDHLMGVKLDEGE